MKKLLSLVSILLSILLAVTGCTTNPSPAETTDSVTETPIEPSDTTDRKSVV